MLIRCPAEGELVIPHDQRMLTVIPNIDDNALKIEDTDAVVPHDLSTSMTIATGLAICLFRGLNHVANLHHGISISEICMKIKPFQ